MRKDNIFNHSKCSSQALYHHIPKRVKILKTMDDSLTVTKDLNKKAPTGGSPMWKKPLLGYVSLTCDASVSNMGSNTGCG